MANSAQDRSSEDKSSGNRFLLVSRVGPKSLHPLWLQANTGRTFDLFLSAYSRELPAQEGPGLFFEHRPGHKVEGYGGFLRDHADLIRRYDYIALFDDDLAINGDDLSRLFTIIADHDLKIAQPALDHESHYTYASLLKHEGFSLRYLNYIEMMCPVFRRDILIEIAPLFDLGFESGIDLVWCNLVAEAPTDFAVIDAVTVCHTLPVGQRKFENGFVGGKRYEDDIDKILKRFDLPWLPCTPYGAVRANGRTVKGRLSLIMPAIRLALIPWRHPRWQMRMRNLAVYWKHLLTARAHNVRVEWR